MTSMFTTTANFDVVVIYIATTSVFTVYVQISGEIKRTLLIPCSSKQYALWRVNRLSCISAEMEGDRIRVACI